MKKKNPDIPLFGSWRGWYWLVFGVLVALIVFFQYLTRRYS
ncbi:hypothetical protein [Flaviaesturariibacter amylovorans]